jgi:TatD DNase family protein
MIDTHCHIDLYDSPLEIAKSAEDKQVTTVAVTYLPSHFQMAEKHLRAFRFVRPALGMHPLAAKDHAKELDLFRSLASSVNLIGEIGLDFSAAVKPTQCIQEKSFAAVLECLKGKKCFITLHSRKAEDDVLRHLKHAGIQETVFHWFSGTRAQLSRVLDAGHFISINTAMIRTAKWRELINFVPKTRVLTESDGPFGHQGARPALPTDMPVVLDWLATQWGEAIEDAEAQVAHTFEQLLPPDCRPR